MHNLRIDEAKAFVESICDAELMATCILIQDFINPDHLTYARRRWSIWEAGYGVAGEVDGVFYCYKRVE